MFNLSVRVIEFHGTLNVLLHLERRAPPNYVILFLLFEKQQNQ